MWAHIHQEGRRIVEHVRRQQLDVNVSPLRVRVKVLGALRISRARAKGEETFDGRESAREMNKDAQERGKTSQRRPRGLVKGGKALKPYVNLERESERESYMPCGGGGEQPSKTCSWPWARPAWREQR